MKFDIFSFSPMGFSVSRMWIYRFSSSVSMTKFMRVSQFTATQSPNLIFFGKWWVIQLLNLRAGRDVEESFDPSFSSRLGFNFYSMIKRKEDCIITDFNIKRVHTFPFKYVCNSAWNKPSWFLTGWVIGVIWIELYGKYFFSGQTANTLSPALS